MPGLPNPCPVYAYAPSLPHMVSASDIAQLRRGLCIWQAYDGTVKADLFSTAIATRVGTFLVDPIQLDTAPLAQLNSYGRVAGVIATNANHLRAADTYTDRFSVPLFAHRKSAPPSQLTEIADGARICGELQTIPLEGAAPGEIAIYHEADGGTLIIGDALINFEPHGFTFLPGKYCDNPKQMRKSLRKLLPCNAERMLFAHGTPILSGAHARLQQLLGADH